MVQHVPVQKVVQKEACFGHGGMQARHEQEMLYGLVQRIQRYVASLLRSFISRPLWGMGRAYH